jgi:hypothetical protein
MWSKCKHLPLVLDDISYVRRDQAETSVLFELIAERNPRVRIVDLSAARRRSLQTAQMITGYRM